MGSPKVKSFSPKMPGFLKKASLPVENMSRRNRGEDREWFIQEGGCVSEGQAQDGGQTE